ncbi:GDCCVxC domain-containing (seleno)protein [Mesorhizobium sp. AR02]|uniref:GDCCVxC domain-containing (seleno)protein n=1 Tax=Mesorhizobium sp. AR02 TaxID=2865837 RepID=UPI00215F8E64|nr:GDCCVxC domain-containing (seleno)protein [Mesorhizobium sp. AR02]
MTQLTSTLTCPHCGFRACETMPRDACQFFYECKGCGTLLRPKAGDCCVFCSFGDVPCPPVQEVQGRLASRGDGDCRG